MGRPVVDRADPQPRRLQPPEARLDDRHCFVAEPDVLRGEGVVVGQEHVLAVHPLGPADGLGVDRQPPAQPPAEVAPVAGGGDQLARPLGVRRGLWVEPGELLPEFGEELRAGLPLPDRLLAVAADEVAPAAFPLAEQSFAFWIRRGPGRPDRRQIPRHAADRRSLLGRQISLGLLFGFLLRLLQLGDAFQLFVPPSLEFRRHQAVVRIDAVILSLGQPGLIPNLFHL
jgi:hypothetical protein